MKGEVMMGGHKECHAGKLYTFILPPQILFVDDAFLIKNANFIKKRFLDNVVNSPHSTFFKKIDLSSHHCK